MRHGTQFRSARGCSLYEGPGRKPSPRPMYRTLSHSTIRRIKQSRRGVCLMDNVIPGLYASVPEPLGFGPSLEIRAYLLEREQGNLLIYRSATLEQDVEAVNDLGGIWRQYLNHHHEASPACDWVTKTFDAPLHVH